MALRNGKRDSLTFTEKKFNEGIIQECRAIANIKRCPLSTVVEEAIIDYLGKFKKESEENRPN